MAVFYKGKQELIATYRYDAMNRLTGEDRGGTGERYAYDLCGNRLLKERYSGSSVDVTEGYRYNERNELTGRITAGILTTYRYDKNGSILSEEEEGRRSEYRYDLLNRQIYVRTLDGREQENLYDGENLRAGLLENGKKTTFLFHNGEILAESDRESAPIKRYLRGIGLSHVQTQDNETYHACHQDEQGSTAYITGQGRETENIYQYDAFGNLLENKESIENRILYTGQQYDQETGQYYLRARYYNPVVGRFLQEDTYRGDGLNLYAYCANNPVVYYDPSGHTSTESPCAIEGTQKPTEETLAGGVGDLVPEMNNQTEVILPSKPHCNKTEGHWETILDEAEQMKNSGEYSKIYVNKGLSNEVSVPKGEHNNRPDIMGVRRDNNLIDQVEVVSKTDNVKDLRIRMKYNQSILGERAGSIKVLYPK